MRRPLRSAALILAALLTVSACGNNAASQSPPETLRIAGPFEIHSLQPTADGEIFTRLQVSETLVTSDLNGNLAPQLATGWQPSANHRTWTFPLRTDATFHDGTPLTGQAVIGSLTKAAAEAASPLAEVPIKSMRAVGSTVVIDLTAPSFTLPAVLTHYSTAILAPAAYEASGKVDAVIGTGPYQIDQIELPATITTKRYDGWRGEAPAVPNVRFQTVSRPEQRALIATSNQADVVFGLEPAGRSRVEASDGVTMASSLQPRTTLLKVNAGNPKLADVRVRRALSLALDRGAMAEAVLRERELAATQLLPPSLKQWSTKVEPLAYNQEEAQQLLTEAGWTPGPDGILTKSGEQLTLRLLTYPDRVELPPLATAIQAELAKIGVRVDVAVSNSSDIPAGHADGSLELALVTKHFALVSDPLIDISAVFAPEGNDWGVMNWQDPALTAAVNALLSGEQTQAQQHRDTVIRIVQEQLPLIPVSWYRMNAAVNDRVAGFEMDPLETSWRITEMSLTS